MKKYYFINKFDTNDIDKQDKQTIIIYRKYDLEKHDDFLIKKIKNYCKKKSIKFYLSNNIKLAVRLNLDGAYIPAFNKNLNHLAYSFKKNFEIIGSAHSIKEIKTKEIQKANTIIISSLFKKNKNYLGINKFKLLKKKTTKEVVPLGGISKSNLNKVKLVNCKSFAGISFFK